MFGYAHISRTSVAVALVITFICALACIAIVAIRPPASSVNTNLAAAPIEVVIPESMLGSDLHVAIDDVSIERDGVVHVAVSFECRAAVPDISATLVAYDATGAALHSQRYENRSLIAGRMSWRLLFQVPREVLHDMKTIDISVDGAKCHKTETDVAGMVEVALRNYDLASMAAEDK